MSSLVWKIFYEFFKIGLFAVGGGPATIPYLMDLADKYDWFTMEDVTNMIAISESTPGPLGLNMATFVGTDALGFLGGAWASIALSIPSVIVIVLVAKFLSCFLYHQTGSGRFDRSSSLQCLRSVFVCRKGRRADLCLEDVCAVCHCIRFDAGEEIL